MRCDGRKVTQDEPIYFLIPYFLTHRYDAMNMITVDVPEEPLRHYMNEKRKEGRPLSHMALLITAYLRTLDKYPDLNRFIGNKTIYEHVDKTVSMVVLKPGGGESMNKLELDAGDDVFAVQKKIDGLNNAAQTDMTRLQSLVDRRDESYSTATNLMSAISDTRSNLIRNL